MPWFYNNHSGEAAEESGAAAIAYELALHAGIGWHEYGTQAEMLAAVAANHWPAPTGSAAQGLQNAAGAAASDAASGVTSGLTSLLSQRTTWVRVTKVVVGLVLVIVGVIQLGGGPGGIVRKAVPL